MLKNEFINTSLGVIKRISINLMFWGWNLLFILFTAILLIPYVFLPLLKSTIVGETPPIFLILTIATILLVGISVAIGVIIKLQEKYVDYEKNALSYIFAFFYGVEIPLILLILYRLFLVRILTIAMAQILVFLFISIALYFYYLYNSFKRRESKTTIIKLVLSVIPLLTGLYISSFLLFYIVPPIYYLFEALTEISIDDIFYFVNPIHFIQLSIVLLIVIFSIGIFATFPFVYLYLNIKVWINNFIKYKTDLGLQKTLIIVISTVSLVFVFTAIINIQNQRKYLKFSEFEDSQISNEEISDFIQNETKIKKNLTNIYLASYRYLSSTGTCSHIKNMYNEITGNEKIAESIQNSYNFIATPFLYKGESFIKDKDIALSTYEFLFDEPMQKVQKKKIKKALTSTWNREEAKAGLLNIDENIVWLKKQNIKIEENGDFASIELYENYENTTIRQQEIFYYFTLPTYAVITGLWLGENENKEEAFKYVVSPRGAAQEVYNRQVRVRRDPALIEKVGPTQYRLRAFPVPGNSRDLNGEKGELHLWLSYATMKNRDGSWPVPKCVEKRNVFWNKKTERTFLNKYFNYKNKDSWLPSSLPGKYSNFNGNVKLSDSLSVSFISQKESEMQGVINSEKKTAIIIDRSRSVNQFSDNITKEFEVLKNIIGKKNIELFLGGYSFEKVENLDNFDVGSILYFGKTSILDEFSNFKKHSVDSIYNKVILLTDDGGYELSEDNTVAPAFSCPVHILHIDNDLPPAYPDNLLETIRKNRGIIAGSVSEFIEKLISYNRILDDINFIAKDNGYRIEKITGNDNIIVDNEAAKAIAAKYLIENRFKKSDMTQLENLDYVHSLAKKYSLVTFYSSMIVLVNNQQKDELRRAESKDDRFKREIEVGKEELSVPLGADVSGVPEPHEWMLLICILSLAIYHFYTKRKTNFQ